LFFRRFLRECLEDHQLVDRYDWVVITRSDFLWPCPHPQVSLLDPSHLYALDGEQYLGISDRHMVLPRRFVMPYLRVVDPVFSDPVGLRDRLTNRQRALAWDYLNPERFLASGMMDSGLWDALRYLPYVPYAVRLPGAHTRWKEGDFDHARGFFVKYPSEERRSQLACRSLTDQRAWERYLHPLWGAPLRTRHRLELAWQGLSGPPTGRRRRRGLVGGIGAAWRRFRPKSG
jgi:hypothetical protein